MPRYLYHIIITLIAWWPRECALLQIACTSSLPTHLSFINCWLLLFSGHMSYVLLLHDEWPYTMPNSLRLTILAYLLIAGQLISAISDWQYQLVP